MSSLNDLLGGLGGLLGGQGGQEGQGGSLISVAGQLIEKAGGLQGLLGILQQHGLGDAVQSWVGTGANQPVSGDQLGQATSMHCLGRVRRLTGDYPGASAVHHQALDLYRAAGILLPGLPCPRPISPSSRRW